MYCSISFKVVSSDVDLLHPESTRPYIQHGHLPSEPTIGLSDTLALRIQVDDNG